MNAANRACPTRNYAATPDVEKEEDAPHKREETIDIAMAK